MRWEGPEELSPQAAERLSRPNESVPVPMPDFADLDAVARWREATHELWGEDVRPGEPDHVEVAIRGVRAMTAGPPDGPLVVYVHGGGFCLGSPGVVVPITARLAAAGLRVISVDYRLAPEHRHPAAVDDVVRACRGLGERPVCLAGDSAGGWIALVAAARLGTSAGVALLSPLVGLPPEPNPLLDAYCDREELRLADGQIAALPPLLVQVGEREDPQPVGAFVRRCASAGVEVDASRWRNMWHTWHYHRGVPESDTALTKAAQWLTARLTPSTQPGG